MFVEIKNLDLLALQKACGRLGLQHSEDTSFRYGRLDFPGNVPGDLDVANRACDGVIKVCDPQPIAGGRRCPFEIGIFSVDGRRYLVWDDYRGGFGLAARIGMKGEKLLQTYATVIVEDILKDRKTSVRVTENEIVEISTTEEDMQKIIVRISPKGEVNMEVVGCEGPSCQSLTEAIEKALGTVVADEKTEEYYRGQDQFVQQSQSQ